MCTLSKYWVKFECKHQLKITFLCPYGCGKKTLLTFYDMENIKYCIEKYQFYIYITNENTYLMAQQWVAWK